jgi:hypothetical protein
MSPVRKTTWVLSAAARASSPDITCRRAFVSPALLVLGIVETTTLVDRVIETIGGRLRFAIGCLAQ